MSAGRLHSGANGGDIARRHGGQRQEESQPAVWPQHPGELQVRAPAQEAWGGGTELPPPPAPHLEAVRQRGSAELRGADAGSAEPLQLISLSFAD